MSDSPFTTFIARVTRRLEDDAELQRDVARELQTHLEDAAEACGGEDANEQAIAHFGGEDELADLLWQTNRRRMRFRAIARWIARLTLLPAAVLTIIFVGSREPFSEFRGLVDPTLAFDVQQSRRAGMTDDQRLLVFGDVDEMVRRWPNDPDIHAAYTARWMDRRNVYEVIQGTKQADDMTTAQLVERTLTILARDEQLEPDNGFYPLMESLVWFAHAGPISQDPAWSMNHERADGRAYSIDAYAMQVRDSAALARAVAALRRAAEKPDCTDHAIDLGVRKLDVIGEPRSYRQLMQATGLSISTVLSGCGQLRATTRHAAGAAVALAASGDVASARRILDLIKRPIANATARSRTLIEVIVGQSLLVVTLAAEAAIADEADEPEAREKLTAAIQRYREYTKDHSQESMQFREHSALVKQILPALPEYRLDPAPARLAEQAVMMRAALAWFLAALTLALAGHGLAAVWRVWRGRPAPMLMFVGWRCMANIWLVTIGAPVVLAFAYGLLPLRSHAMGMHVVPGLRVLEVVLFLAMALVLMRALSYRAVRRRAIELGIDVPPPVTWCDRRGSLAISMLLLVCAIVSIGYMQAALRVPPGVAPDPRDMSLVVPLPVAGLIALWVFVMGMGETIAIGSPAKRVGVINGWMLLFLGVAITVGTAAYDLVFHEAKFLTVMMVFVSLAGLLAAAIWTAVRVRKLSVKYQWFAASYGRSVQPILAGAIVLLGLCVGLPLQRGETWAVRQLPHPLWFHEVELSAISDLRDEIVAELRERPGSRSDPAIEQ